MKTKFGATVLAGVFLAVLVFPWTVLAGGGGGGRGGGAGSMGGQSIGNQTRMQNDFQIRGMDQVRAQDRVRDQDRERVRQQIHKMSGTGPSAATTEIRSERRRREVEERKHLWSGRRHGPLPAQGRYGLWSSGKPVGR